MKKAVLTILQFFLFLIVFGIGSLFPPFHFEHILIATPGVTRIFVADGLLLMFALYVLIILVEVMRKRLRIRGAVDHPRRYTRDRSRAYDEVRLPYEVGVLEHPCQTNSSNSSPNRQRTLDEGFAHLPPHPTPPLSETAVDILQQVATRLHDNYPYAHPLYAGQMLKPPHPIARAAYALAMSVNPNNHALDGGRASSAMEIEAVAALAKMFHWPEENGGISATSAAEEPSPISKPSGSPANSTPIQTEHPKQSPPPTRPTTPTAASAEFSVFLSSPSPPTNAAAWISPSSKRSSRPARSAQSSSP